MSRWFAWGSLSIPLLASVTYLTTLDNFFISDDFVILSILRVLEREPLRLWHMPPEVFRATSYAYTMLCYRLFGLNSVAYYALGILLHATTALLVYALVARITKDAAAGLAAALFFAAYERHQEAVMWISAVNDLLLTLFSTLCLLCWYSFLRGSTPRLFYYLGTVMAFLLALFSKEPAVVLVPAMVAIQLLMREPGQGALAFLYRISRFHAPFFVLGGLYAGLWLVQSRENSFLVHGFYSFGPHFFPVCLRSLVRLISQLAFFLVPLLLLSALRRKGGKAVESYEAWVPWRDRAAIFFAGLLLLAVGPYCFLTYLDHIPSRNTYLPSVALAAIVGILVSQLYKQARPLVLGRALVTALFLAVISVNVLYVVFKKEGEYVRRARPTRELINALNEASRLGPSNSVIYVCGFPLQEVVGRAAVEIFTPLDTSQVIFHRAHQTQVDPGINLIWDVRKEAFVRRLEGGASAP